MISALTELQCIPSPASQKNVVGISREWCYIAVDKPGVSLTGKKRNPAAKQTTPTEIRAEIYDRIVLKKS